MTGIMTATLPPLIKPKSCRTCKFFENGPGTTDQPGTCHHGPPSAAPILVPQSKGMFMVQIHGGFAPVQPDQWCGQHTPRIAIANEAAA